MFPFTPHTTLRLNIVRAVPFLKQQCQSWVHPSDRDCPSKPTALSLWVQHRVALASSAKYVYMCRASRKSEAFSLW